MFKSYEFKNRNKRFIFLNRFTSLVLVGVQCDFSYTNGWRQKKSSWLGTLKANTNKGSWDSVLWHPKWQNVHPVLPPSQSQTPTSSILIACNKLSERVKFNDPFGGNAVVQRIMGPLFWGLKKLLPLAFFFLSLLCLGHFNSRSFILISNTHLFCFLLF